MLAKRFVPLTRRQMLQRCANGFGAVALAALLQDEARSQNPRTANPMTPRQPHTTRCGVTGKIARSRICCNA